MSQSYAYLYKLGYILTAYTISVFNLILLAVALHLHTVNSAPRAQAADCVNVMIMDLN